MPMMDDADVGRTEATPPGLCDGLAGGSICLFPNLDLRSDVGMCSILFLVLKLMCFIGVMMSSLARTMP